MNTRNAYTGAALVLGSLLLAVVVILLFFTATVETGSVGVITNFGKVTGTCSTPAGTSSGRSIT